MYKRKDGLFEKSITVDGVRTVFYGKTERAVNKKILEYKEEAKAGPLFSTVAAEWYEDMVTRVRYGTLRCYTSAYTRAVEEFGALRIRSIETCDISAWLQRLKSQGYAKKTIGNHKIVVNQIFTFWISSPKWRGDRNPCALAQTPTHLKENKRQPPTEEQLSLVRSHPEGFGLAAHLLMYTGIRLGEANGLQWKDVHLDRDTFGIKGGIYIHQAAPWRGNQPYMEDTKTDSGVRWVPILPPLAKLLKPLAKQHGPEDFVLSGTNKPITQSSYTAMWVAYLRPLGLASPTKRSRILHQGTPRERPYDVTIYVPDVTAHQFRHAYATVLYEAGVPEMVAQQLMGHADISTTHAIYTHIREGVMKQSAVALQDYVEKQLKAQ